MKLSNLRMSPLGRSAIVLACSLSFLAVCASARAEKFACSQATDSPYPALVATGHHHMRYAPEGSGLRKDFTAYSAVFDDADDDDGDGAPDLRLNPEFVSYEIQAVEPNAAGDYREPDLSITRPRWYRSSEFVPLMQSIPGVRSDRLDDSYSGIATIWNRGHLAMSDHAQRINGPAACNTHTFWNASPQAAEMNQGPWLHLENYSASAANKFGRVWVIAGPIFDRATPKLTIGDAGEAPVEIPDAFFKVIIRETPAGPDTLAFLFDQPNSMGPNGKPRADARWVKCNAARGQQHTYDHAPQLVAIAQIELRTGLRFFADRADREALTAAKAGGLWPIETRFWDTGVCAGQRGHP